MTPERPHRSFFSCLPLPLPFKKKKGTWIGREVSQEILQEKTTTAKIHQLCLAGFDPQATASLWASDLYSLALGKSRPIDSQQLIHAILQRYGRSQDKHWLKIFRLACQAPAQQQLMTIVLTSEYLGVYDKLYDFLSFAYKEQHPELIRRQKEPLAHFYQHFTPSIDGKPTPEAYQLFSYISQLDTSPEQVLARLYETGRIQAKAPHLQLVSNWEELIDFLLGELLESWSKMMRAVIHELEQSM